MYILFYLYDKHIYIFNFIWPDGFQKCNEFEFNNLDFCKIWFISIKENLSNYRFHVKETSRLSIRKDFVSNISYFYCTRHFIFVVWTNCSWSINLLHLRSYTSVYIQFTIYQTYKTKVSNISCFIIRNIYLYWIQLF